MSKAGSQEQDVGLQSGLPLQQLQQRRSASHRGKPLECLMLRYAAPGQQTRLESDPIWIASGAVSNLTSKTKSLIFV